MAAAVVGGVEYDGGGAFGDAFDYAGSADEGGVHSFDDSVAAAAGRANESPTDDNNCFAKWRIHYSHYYSD